MNKGAICSTVWPRFNRKVANMNLPECGRFSPFSKTSMACLIHGGYSVDVTVGIEKFFAKDVSFSTDFSNPCSIEGVVTL